MNYESETRRGSSYRGLESESRRGSRNRVLDIIQSESRRGSRNRVLEVIESDSRRGSRSRALERSLSYSEAIGSSSRRSSIEIPSIVNTDVYANEELKKQYRISQTYVEGREISFPNIITSVETHTPNDKIEHIYASEDETTDDGLTLTIDEGSPETSDLKHISDLSTQVVSDDTYDRIELADFDDSTLTAAHGYSTPYSKRKKKGSRHK